MYAVLTEETQLVDWFVGLSRHVVYKTGSMTQSGACTLKFSALGFKIIRSY